MEPVSLATLAAFLFTILKESSKEGSKTLTTESVKLALEKRHDIRDRVVEIFRPKFTALNLSEDQTPEEVKALIDAKPDVATELRKKIESDSDLLKELIAIIKKQAKKDSSQITINAKNIAAAGNVKIKKQKIKFS